MNWSIPLITNIKVCWKPEDYINLDYALNLGGYGEDIFKQYSHKPYENSISNDVYALPNPMPKFVDEVMDQFKYDIVAVAFNRTPPGCILPLHGDHYTNFLKAYNIKDVNDIHRYIIFLEDAKLGHMMQIEKQVYADWQAGDVLSWTGTTSHAAYNMGIEHRYTMQITCSNK